tara:strand:- start:248 stop:430 length:183 start_codon:yes stop_codon:yes gene_type:complete
MLRHNGLVYCIFLLVVVLGNVVADTAKQVTGKRRMSIVTTCDVGQSREARELLEKVIAFT